MSRVLLVEDEEHLALGLRFNLENAGYEVALAQTGDEALDRVGDGFDLVLLDVNLPSGPDGYDVARQIRQSHNFLPIIIVSARDRPEDRIRGIDAGADDFITKPFDLDELLARVRGHLRRQVWHRREQPDGDDDGQPEPLTFGPCRVDFRTYRAVDHSGQEVQLTWKEAEIMRLFRENEGEIIPRARFLEEVWGEPGTLETRTVDNFIMRLRRYFEPTPKKPQHILSVRGVGYRFVR